MRLSKSTAFLSIMFLDFLVVNDKPSQLCSLNIKDHLYIFSGVCVMVAAKSIELDEKIPFLSTLKKYLCLNQYSKDDLRRAEQKTVDILKFNLQLPTLFDLLEYYGSQGVILSNDTQKNSSLNQPQKPVNFSSLTNEQPKHDSGKKEQNINNRTIELEFQGPVSSKQSQQQSESEKNSSQNLNDNSLTQETSSKNSNSEEHQPSCSPPSHQIPEIQPIILRDIEISPFKFYDIVQKIEKDFSKLAFYAIKGNNIQATQKFIFRTYPNQWHQIFYYNKKKHFNFKINDDNIIILRSNISREQIPIQATEQSQGQHKFYSIQLQTFQLHLKNQASKKQTDKRKKIYFLYKYKNKLLKIYLNNLQELKFKA